MVAPASPVCRAQRLGHNALGIPRSGIRKISLNNRLLMYALGRFLRRCPAASLQERPAQGTTFN